MKKIMMSAGVFSFMLLTAPLVASPNCMDNSEHLTKAYDDKEWHSVDCACDCTTIKGGHCVDCGHMQDAHPLTIVKLTETEKLISQQNNVQEPQTVKEALNNLMKKYRNNH